MKTSENIGELAKALAAFQGEVKQPEKDAVNPHFKNRYVTLDGIVKSIHAAGPKHGLSFIQVPTVGEQGVSVSTVILHSSGQFIEFEPITLPMDRKNAQGAGSAITYAKRYSLAAAFGIVSDEDDDGNQASEPPKASQQRQSAPKQDGNIITAQQMKALGSAVQAKAEQHSMTAAQVYEDAAKACGVEGKQSKQLTRQEASKIIEYLNGMK